MSSTDWDFEVFNSRLREVDPLRRWAEDKKREAYHQILSGHSTDVYRDLENMLKLVNGVNYQLDKHAPKLEDGRIYCWSCESLGKPSFWPCEPLRVLMMVLP